MQKIEVNALIGFDNIKIVATSNARDKMFCIHNEKINITSLNRETIKSKLKKIFESIENKTSTKVRLVNIIFDDFMKNVEHLKISTKILKETLDFKTEKFLEVDSCKKIISNMIKKAKEKELNKELISVVPFRFIFIENGSEQKMESSAFPVGKKISFLEIIFTVRYMEKDGYLKVVDYFDSLNLKINNVVLESQISIYEFEKDENSNKMDFILSIQNNRTLLLSSINNVVVKTDSLNFSFDNLVKKISKTFEISIQEAKNIIDCYGTLNTSDESNNEIIYSSNLLSSDVSKPIRKIDITDTIKSFLKSISIQANSIINKRINNIETSEIKMIGKLSNVTNSVKYCSKYFDKVLVSKGEKNNSIFSWNKGIISSNNYQMYMSELNNKLNPEAFYYKNNDSEFNKNSRINKKPLIESENKRTSEAILV